MLIEPDIGGVAIVLVGNLNPRIFTPHWFAGHDLLSSKEADTAEVEIVHRQITQFQTDWLSLRVESERFQASTNQSSIRLRDFVVRTFKEFLPHTPIGMLGINRHVHFKVASQEIRDRIGYKLAPPDVWGEWAPMIRAGTGERHGGLVSLVMQQGDLDDRINGYIRATVQPSSQIEGRTGIFVQINDHYEAQDRENVSGCDEIIELLERRFDKSRERSEWIIDQVMRLKDA